MKFLQEYTNMLTELQSRELESARQVFEKPADDKRTSVQRAFEQVAGWLSIKKAEKPEGLNLKMLDWYAKVWSQGHDAETHWTVDELQTLEQNDPALLSWMISATWQTRQAHMEQKKKV
jgi:hypothetical protein